MYVPLFFHGIFIVFVFQENLKSMQAKVVAIEKDKQRRTEEKVLALVSEKGNPEEALSKYKRREELQKQTE